MAITLTVNTAEATQMVRTIQGQIQNLTPVLEAIKERLVSSVVQNFSAGGRPTPWAPLQYLRARGSRSAAVPLTDTGRLKGSILGVVQGNTVTIGTNVAYAPIHQFGGTIQVPEIRPRQPGGVLRFVTQDGTVVYTRRVRAHSVTIPARPFLLAQTDDIDQSERLLVDHVLRGL